MKATIESTTRIVELSGVRARVWEGKTDKGVPFVCFVALCAVDKKEDAAEFERDLKEHRAPSAEALSFPGAMVL